MEKRLIYSTCIDVMTQKDFITHMEDTWNDIQHYGYDELIDCTPADWSQFGFTDIFDIVRMERELLALSVDSKFAWLVKEGTQYEIANYYITSQSFASTKSRKIKIFYSELKAMEWLER